MSRFARRLSTAANHQSVLHPQEIKTPADFEGLRVWLKADAITGLTDGATVTDWPDSSGNGYDALESTVSPPPTYTTNASSTGLPGVAFTGGNQLDSNAPAGDPEQTIVAVVTFNTLDGKQAIRGADWQSIEFMTINGELRLASSWNRAVQYGSDPAVTTGTPCIVAGTISKPQGTYAYRVGINEAGYGTQDLEIVASTSYIGATMDQADYLDGTIHEYASFDRVLTPSELDQVLEGLDYKWNGVTPPSWTVPDTPTITMLSYASTATPTLQGTAKMRANVAVTIDNKRYETIANGNGYWRVDMPQSDALGNGNYTITATAANAAGTSLAASQALTVGVIPAVTGTGKFQVDGWHIKDPDGNEFVPIGANVNGVRWVWPAPTIGMSAYAKNNWHWTCIRLNCEMPTTPDEWPVDMGGSTDAPPQIYTTNDDIDGIIAEYTAPDPDTGRRVVVMVANHWKHAGSIPSMEPGSAPDGSGRSELEGITDWFVELATNHGDNPYFWINLINEPGDDPSTSLPDLKAYYDQLQTVYDYMIPRIRAVAPDTVIVADSSCYANDIPQLYAGNMGDGPVPFTMEQDGTDYPWTFAANYGPGLIQAYGPAAGYGPVLMSIHMYSRWGWAPNVGDGTMVRDKMDARVRDYIKRMHTLNIPFMFGEMGPEPFAYAGDYVAAQSALYYGGDFAGVPTGYTDENGEFHRVGITWWHGDPGAWGMGLFEHNGHDGMWYDVTDRTLGDYFGKALWDYTHSVT